jgi:hypothetical protein
MKWGDVNHKHNGRTAKLSAPSTPENPITGEGPHVGIIQCGREDRPVVPVLLGRDGMVHYFAEWFDVELKWED